MSAEVQNQFYFFFFSAFWGVGMGFIYDGLRIWRRLVHHSLRQMNIQDIVYWICMTVVLFYLLFTYNRGEIRSYTIAGMIVGCVFYQKTISPVWVELAYRLLRPVIHLFFVLFSIIKKIRRKICG